MTVPHRVVALRPSVTDQITLAALEYTEPFTAKQLARKTGRVVLTWLNRMVREGDLTRTWDDDARVYFFEWSP